jgi:hypothetical protein
MSIIWPTGVGACACPGVPPSAGEIGNGLGVPGVQVRRPSTGAQASPPSTGSAIVCCLGAPLTRTSAEEADGLR